MKWSNVIIYDSINNRSNMKLSLNEFVVMKYFSLPVIDKALKGLSVNGRSDCFGNEINTV